MFDLFGYWASVTAQVVPLAFAILLLAIKIANHYIRQVVDDTSKARSFTDSIGFWSGDYINLFKQIRMHYGYAAVAFIYSAMFWIIYFGAKSREKWATPMEMVHETATCSASAFAWVALVIGLYLGSIHLCRAVYRLSSALLSFKRQFHDHLKDKDAHR